MNSVEQNKLVGNKQDINFPDSGQIQKLPLPNDADTMDVTTVALPKATKVVKAVKDVQVVKEAPQRSLSFPSKKAQEEAQALRVRCKQICVSAFFQQQTPIHSLGFTSAIAGEGKSFFARITAEAMAEDDNIPVTLLECNWEHPSFSADFHLTRELGLADWLREDCNLTAIRHQVYPNLTVIPAGNSKNNEIALLRTFQQRRALSVLTRPQELLIVDLPSITTAPYGRLAASLIDSLILVVRAGVTPESFVTEATSMLKDLPMQGVVLNQVKSRVPRWLRQIL